MASSGIGVLRPDGGDRRGGAVTDALAKAVLAFSPVPGMNLRFREFRGVMNVGLIANDALLWADREANVAVDATRRFDNVRAPMRGEKVNGFGWACLPAEPAVDARFEQNSDSHA